MQMVFVSTGGFPRRAAPDSVKLLLEANITNIELSGGQFFEPGIASLGKLRPDCNLLLHNYFPPPKKAFVLNLASADPSVTAQSLTQVRTALQWTAELGANVYSVHAGFLIDPLVSELGSDLKQKRVQDRSVGLDVFLGNLNTLAIEAAEMGITLLVENNVLTRRNLEAYKSNPLLMVDADECAFVMANTPSNVELLLDVGHINVSAKTLGFDRTSMLSTCSDWTRGYHLSHNDGVSDSNGAISSSDWYWSHLKSKNAFASVEVYGLHPQELRKQQQLVIDLLPENATA